MNLTSTKQRQHHQLRRQIPSQNTNNSRLHGSAFLSRFGEDGQLKSTADIRLEQARLKASVLENDAKGAMRCGERGRMYQMLAETAGNLRDENERRRKQLLVLAKQKIGGAGKQKIANLSLVSKNIAKASRQLDALKYQRSQAAAKLNALTKECTLLLKQYRQSRPKFRALKIAMPLDFFRKQSTAQLEVKVDVARAKCTELQNVQRTYQSLTDTLALGVQTLHSQLGARERDLKRLQTDIEQISGVNSDADKTRNISKVELNALEGTIATEKSKKENQISKLKFDLESRKNYNEILEKKQIVKQSLFAANNKDSDSNSEFLNAEKHSSKNRLNLANGFGEVSSTQLGQFEPTVDQMAAYHAMLDTAKSVTGIANLSGLIASYENQDTLGKLLKATLESKQAELGKLHAQLAELQRTQDDRRFTRKLHRSAMGGLMAKAGLGAKASVSGRRSSSNKANDASWSPAKAIGAQMAQDLAEKTRQQAVCKMTLDKRARVCSEAKKTFQNLNYLLLRGNVEDLIESFEGQNSEMHPVNNSSLSPSFSLRIHSAGTKESLGKEMEHLEARCQVLQRFLQRDGSALKLLVKEQMSGQESGSKNSEYKQLVEQLEVAHDLTCSVQSERVDEPLQDGQEDLLQYVHGSRVLSRGQIKQRVSGALKMQQLAGANQGAGGNAVANLMGQKESKRKMK